MLSELLTAEQAAQHVEHMVDLTEDVIRKTQDEQQKVLHNMDDVPVTTGTFPRPISEMTVKRLYATLASRHCKHGHSL